MELLREVKRMLDENFFFIENIDATVIAQQPKLAPYIEAMRKNIADCLELSVNRVNVKATTEEKLGFTGAGLGISAQAVCLSAAAFDAAESQSGYKIYAENLHPGGRQSTVLVRRNPAVHYLYYDNDCKISTDTLPDSWQCGSRKSSGKDKAVCS